MKTVK